jgi:putative aldouronate transport system substrate-binding protein
LPSDPPGAGSTILATVVGLYPPPTPVDQNPAWQAVNKALNVDFRFDVVPLADYTAKIGTLMAGSSNDLPDIIGFFSAPSTSVPNLPAYLQHSAADLTPYLSGDAIKDYPNLAAIPTYAWQNSGAVINGHVYGIPLERWAVGGNQLFKNSQLYDATIGKDYTPTSADDFKRVLQALTQPEKGVWGFGGFQGSAYLVNAYFVQMFGAPNNWMVDSGGKLVKDIETDQYRQAVAYVRDLVAAGVMHPDSQTTASQTAYRDMFVAGKIATAVQAFGNNWFDVWSKGQKADPRVDFSLVSPFPSQQGAKPITYLGAGYNSLAALKSAPADRINEILHVMNWLAAPFGSQEDLLLTNGLEGTHYNLDPNANPIATPAWNADVNNVPWRYVVQHPQVIYYPGAADFIKFEYAAEQVLLPPGLSDPTLGLPSPTNDTRGVKLNLAVMDALGDIVAGRRPAADYDQVVKDWQSNGGEQIRTEFQQQLAVRG